MRRTRRNNGGGALCGDEEVDYCKEVRRRSTVRR